MSAERPYQSHLLSFLNRQLQVAKDRTGRLWRTVKINATTALNIGIQAILYPFYAVLKAAELVGKQIGQSQGMAAFWLRSGLNNPDLAVQYRPSDSPLTNLLTALTQRQLASTAAGEADELTLALAAQTTIQGVASRISDRRLVLVSPTQQILDILCDRQVLDIQKRISYEIALYLRWLSSRTLRSRTLRSRTLSSPDSNRKSILPQSWRLGRRSSLQGSAQAAIVRIPTLSSHSTPHLGFFSLPNLQDLPSLQELPTLLQAAFKYFFGRTLGLGSATPHYARRQPTLVAAQPLDDPWFTSETLFGFSEVIETPATRSIPTAAKPVLTGTAKSSTASLPPAKPITLKRTQLSIKSSTPAQLSTRAKTSPRNPTRDSDLIESFDHRPVFAPDWLEAEAQHLGYDRTWLDRAVGVLDEILLWIEKTFLTIWAYLSGLFHSR